MTDMARLLLAWYRHRKRTLPWRSTRDPYAVWVAEVMLQQTRVETVIPYFERWMRRFPTVEALAAASEQEVLSLWEGLGYYSRARNLHRAARVVMERHGGKLPADVDALRALPGIGRYTAGAIASIAFGLDEPALDGNQKRVLARLFDVRQRVDSAEGERLLWSLAREHLPPGRAAEYNQALMDLGASICTPRRPDCTACPLREVCRAHALGVQEALPVKKPKGETPHYVHAAAVVMREGRVLLARRPSQGLLGGLWEFPNARLAQVKDDAEAARALEDALETGYGLGVRVGASLGSFRHAYSHFRVTVYAFRCALLSTGERTSLEWAAVGALDGYPMGRVDRQIARWVDGG